MSSLTVSKDACYFSAHFATPPGQGEVARVLLEIERRAQKSPLPVPPPLDVLHPEVAHKIICYWLKPCEAMFDLLAQKYPAELAKLISSGKLLPADLTFAAESLGRSTDGELAKLTLVPLLDHSSALVREGAIYGLQRHLNEEIRGKIQHIADNDPSPGVRSSATDLLS